MSEILIKLGLCVVLGAWCMVTWAALYSRTEEYRKNIQPREDE